MENLFIGKNRVELDTVDSTNSFTKEWLTTAHPVEGTVVTAKAQTAGRGQLGTTWLTEEGQNLTCSYILYPTFLPADKSFYLSMAVALGVKDFCEEFQMEPVSIKWPNDIFIGNKKVAGILIENTISQAHLQTSVVGIGININQTNLEKELPHATSFFMQKNKSFSLEKCLETMSLFIEKYYLQVKKGNYQFLESAYTTALFQYRKTAAYKTEKGIFKGQILNVTKEGKLIIESNGKELRFGLKEVEFVL